ncbi:hypothetical protein M0R45_001905 [Rubus argutus]|uniref:Uncharacterized protein n=1 Tax=Rubus argutus TaxID=59490 RepID=A0AAW1VK43_RUBAR
MLGPVKGIQDRGGSGWEVVVSSVWNGWVVVRVSEDSNSSSVRMESTISIASSTSLSCGTGHSCWGDLVQAVQAEPTKFCQQDKLPSCQNMSVVDCINGPELATWPV